MMSFVIKWYVSGAQVALGWYVGGKYVMVYRRYMWCTGGA